MPLKELSLDWLSFQKLSKKGILLCQDTQVTENQASLQRKETF
jgi:hypothetical protein